ncbi:hypothetical protein ACHAQH_000006 [Verticillium albo-atrum]
MFHTKLVLSASIVDFLRELAHEKAKQQGVSQEDCAARLETLSTVIDLIDSGKGNLIDEVQEPFVYVDDCIDANDEQSLGNWFGFWSLTKLDCYRKFHILGSHENDYSRSLRDVRIPRYAPKTTGDPDQAYAQAEQAVADINEPTRALDNSGAQSQILGRADGEEFGRYLTSDQFIHVRGLMKLYGFAVSWFNDSFQMADHFGDTSFKFKTYRNWFSYTFPFGQNKGYNTYVALFYTIELEWDPAAYPQKRFSKRHPWIGIWRVRNPHLQPYRFPPTLEWYTRQKAEGRHYEYINVDSGEGVFSSIGAPTVDGKLVLRKENAEVESTSTSAQTTPRN